MDITQFVYSGRETALQLGGYGTYKAQLGRRLASLRRRLGRSTPKNAKYATKPEVTAEDIGGNPE
jgi:signal recognition particle subunit SRP68